MDRNLKNSIVPTSSAKARTVRIPTVLFLGESTRAEMQPIMTWIKEQILPAARTCYVSEMDEIHDLFSGELFPDLIVVFQSWSDQYSASDIHHLMSFAPLARLIVCYGSWCESDGRNRNLWPLSVRVPVWAAIDRLEREWQSIIDSTATLPLPWSASREEVFAEDHAESNQIRKLLAHAETFLVVSPDIHYQNSVQDLLSAVGRRSDPSHPTLVLFDADPWNEIRLQSLNSLRIQFPHARYIILTNCIDHASLAVFHKLGINGVVHKLGFREQFPPD